MHFYNRWTRQMMQKTALTALLTASMIVPVGLTPTIADAATTNTPKAYINSILNPAASKVLVRNGVTYLTLTDLQSLGAYQFNYKSATKQVIVTGDGNTYTFTIGSTKLLRNSSTITLSSAPIVNEGKMMLPLRATAQAFGGHAKWNPATQSAFIYKADAQTLANIQSENLTTARNAALHLPTYSNLSSPLLTNSNQGGVAGDANYQYTYYFPQGKSDEFFIQYYDLISYYKVQDDAAELLWQANVENTGSSEIANLFFLGDQAKITKEIGTRPNASDWTVASFFYVLISDETTYEIRNRSEIIVPAKTVNLQSTNGNSTTNPIIDIPDERK